MFSQLTGKKTYVAPILMKVDPFEWENYRPISMTLTFAKKFEKLLLQQIIELTEEIISVL